jgi:hypothetical protein
LRKQGGDFFIFRTFQIFGIIKGDFDVFFGIGYFLNEFFNFN